MHTWNLIAVAAAAVAASACSNNGGERQDTNQDNAGSGVLTEAPSVPLVDAKGQIIGEVQGGDSDRGARLLITARGLPPGTHGIHIHETGLCEPPDFKSAGGHWNPAAKQHGSENPNGAHMGDLQNITVGEDGNLKVEVFVPGTYLRNAGRDTPEGKVQILDQDGAAIVIHADADDYKTDPSGNSGARIACAVLGSPAPGSGVTAGDSVTANDMVPANTAAANAANTNSTR